MGGGTERDGTAEGRGRGGERERFELPYREDVDIFFTCNERECRERHAFDWPGRREPVMPVEGGQLGGGAGGPPFAVDFSGLFFTGDGPRLPG